VDKRNLLILFAVFLLALFFRIISLSSLPFSLHTDEVYAGYIGRYIFLHGQDIYGNVAPLYFNKFGDFRPIGIFWTSGLSTFIFGINEFAIRFPSALFGALTVFPLYFLTLQLFKNKGTALLSSLLLAILPWHIVLSRATSEAIIGLFFFTSSACFMFFFIKKEKIKYAILALGLGLVAYLFYHSFRIILPLIFLPFPFLVKNKKIKIPIIITVIVFFVVTIGISLTNQGVGRFNQVAFYRNGLLTSKIETLKAGEGNNHVLSARIFHNKIVIYSREFLMQYFSYLSPAFLLEDKGMPGRYASPEQGLLYYMFVPSLIAALMFFLPYSEKNRKTWFVFYLLAVAIIPAALTYEDSPNISRSAVMTVPLVILGALGIYAFFAKIKTHKFRNFLLVLCFFLFLLEFIYFWHQYSVHAKTLNPVYRNEGNREAINYALKSKNKYGHVYMTTASDFLIYYLYYSNSFGILNPGAIRKVESEGGELNRINFINNICFDVKFPKNSLVILGDECRDMGFPTKMRIQRSDGTMAFKALEVR
jgi:4-amino-4-deoxy-L-arabinose transferase-like glycosyltransferase